MNQIFELASIGGAVVGDLEMEITKMDAEISYLTKELERAERFKAEAKKLSTLWRNHLNDGRPMDDNEWESQARQELWDDSDTQQQKEDEGNGNSEWESVPF